MALTFNSVDPRTGEPGPSYEEATPEDVHAAAAAQAELGIVAWVGIAVVNVAHVRARRD
jgi:hypothetical protein